MITVKATGLEGAQELIETLQEMGARTQGVALLGRQRGSINNAQIIRSLAGVDEDGNLDPSHKGPRRDLRPTQEDSDDAARKFITEAEKRLQIIARKKAQAKTKALKNKLSNKRKNANAVAGSGLKAAGTLIRDRMLKNLEQGKTSDGEEAAPVSEKYAKQRELKYGVPVDVVYKATGQLLSNLQAGNLKLYQKKTFKLSEFGLKI